MGNVIMNTEKNNNPNLEHIKKIYYWRTAFFGLVILIAGIVIGSATKPGPGPEFNILQVIPPLRRNLGLSQEQSDKIKPILDGHMKKLQDIRENARSEIENTLQQMNKEISTILTETQRQRWQREMSQLQRDLRPGGPRRNGMGRGRRGIESGGRRGGRGQREFYRRGFQSEPLVGPNSLRNDVNEKEIGLEGLDPNMDY